jgi:tRNA(Ile)-lysidine synthase
LRDESKDYLVNRVFNTIKHHDLIQNGDSLVVGISGGPDSVCLIHVLYTIADKLNIKLFAVHINHMLRGRESDEDEQYVRSLCEAINIKLFVESIDIGREASKRGVSLEEAGREARYTVFNRIAREVGATRIAVAHNKNDQAETVLLNMMRGAGLDGLTGMKYIRNNIIRPLLDVEREHIERYCARHSLNPRVDRTNLEDIYTRNKIRLNLIPYINRLMDLDIVGNICRMSSLLRDDACYIDGISREFFNKSIVRREDGKIWLDIQKLKACHPAMQRRVLRNALSEVKGDLKGIESVHISSVIDMFSNGRTGSQLHLPSGLRAEVSYGQLSIYLKGSNRKEEKLNISINIPGITNVRQSYAFLEAFVEKREKNIEEYGNIRYNSLVQYFDYDKLKLGINIRNRGPGDVFKPFKSNGTKKLKEYFIDNKVPRDLRDKILLIAKGKEIVWVIGYKISDKFKVTENTKTVLKLNYILRTEVNGQGSGI